MAQRLYEVIVKKQYGLTGDLLKWEAPDRNCLLQSLTLNMTAHTEKFTPVLIFRDEDGDVISGAVAPGDIKMTTPFSIIGWSVGGAEHAGPYLLQGTLPVFALEPGFTVEVLLDGAAAPQDQIFDTRVSFKL